MKRLVFAIFALALITGCRKNREVVVTGVITEGYSGQVIDGVEVELSFSELRNASYSLGYTILGTAISHEDGTYTYSFDRVAAVNYRVRCTKNGYVLHEEFIQTDGWTVGEENVLDIEMFIEATLTFQLMNSTDPSSQLLLRLDKHSEGCDFCCPYDATIRVAGINDTSFTCNVFGNQTIQYKTTRINPVEAVEQVHTIQIEPGDNAITIGY